MRKILVGLSLAIAVVAMSPSESEAQVAVVNTAIVPPAQTEAFLTLVAEAEAVVQKHSPETEVDAWLTMYGPAANQIRLVAIFPSAEAFGVLNDKLSMDDEYRAVVAELNGLGIDLGAPELIRNIPLP